MNNAWRRIETLLGEMCALQETKVLGLARRLKPGLTAEDIRNPHDHDALYDPDFSYEDGVLAGLLGALVAVRRERRELRAVEPDVAHSATPMTLRVGPPGILIAIEGIDGAGKTTQCERLAFVLGAMGFEVLRTKEPTDGPHGRRLRESASGGRLSPEDELSTFIADRREHVQTVLEPALDAGRVLLVDRYYFSSAAYQGARGLDPEKILAANEAFAPQPDLLVLMVLPASVGVSRVGSRGAQNLFEREEDLRASAAIFARIERPYLLRVDATQTPEVITREIITALRDGPLRAHRELLANYCG